MIFGKFQHEVVNSEFIINKIGKVGSIIESELKRFITKHSERWKPEPICYLQLF